MRPCFTDEVKVEGSCSRPRGRGGVGSRVGAHDPLPAKVPMCVSGNRRDPGTCGSRSSRSWADHLRLILSPCTGALRRQG